jgi:hypothetical protein
LQLAQQEQGMSGKEYLHAACSDGEDAGCDDLDQFRIEVAFRLVPEEIPLFEQHARTDEAREHRHFPQALGHQGHLHIPFARDLQIKAAGPAIDDHFSAHRLFQWLEQLGHPFFFRTPQQRVSEQRHGITPGFLEFQMIVFVQGKEPRA